MGKGFNQPSRYVEAVQRVHDHGIGIMGTFIVGLDDDDPGVFQRIIDFCTFDTDSTGPSPLSWPLTLEQSPSTGWKGKEESSSGIGRSTIP